MSFSLIVGLGNPGRQYEETRHNVGFMVMDRLAAASGAVFQSSPKWQSHLAKLPESGTLLLKPQTFMNLSGRAIKQILSFHKWTPEQMLVIYDDVALPFDRPMGLVVDPKTNELVVVDLENRVIRLPLQ